MHFADLNPLSCVITVFRDKTLTHVLGCYKTLTLNLPCEQVDGVGRVQLARTVYNFTDMQDVRVVLGYRMHVDKAGRAVGVRPLT